MAVPTYNKADLRSLIKVSALTYRAQIKLDDRTIDLNGHRAEMDVWSRYVQIDERFFRKSASIADAANLPSDFGMLANNAVDGAGLTASYIDISETSFRQANKWDLASATSPSYYISAQKFKILPIGSSPLTIDYYFLPTDMSNPASADSTVSSMPNELKYLVAMGATRRCFQTMMEQADTLNLSIEERQNITGAIESLADLYNKEQMKEAKHN